MPSIRGGAHAVDPGPRHTDGRYGVIARRVLLPAADERLGRNEYLVLEPVRRFVHDRRAFLSGLAGVGFGATAQGCLGWSADRAPVAAEAHLAATDFGTPLPDRSAAIDEQRIRIRYRDAAGMREAVDEAATERPDVNLPPVTGTAGVSDPDERLWLESYQSWAPDASDRAWYRVYRGDVDVESAVGRYDSFDEPDDTHRGFEFYSHDFERHSLPQRVAFGESAVVGAETYFDSPPDDADADPLRHGVDAETTDQTAASWVAEPLAAVDPVHDADVAVGREPAASSSAYLALIGWRIEGADVERFQVLAAATEAAFARIGGDSESSVDAFRWSGLDDAETEVHDRFAVKRTTDSVEESFESVA